MLTDEQETASAERAGSLVLSAAAGSGKTRVLVERFVRAVREDGIGPRRILAITFTERAAGELRARVRERFACERDGAALVELERAPIGTIHGFCARLLRAQPLLAGVAPGFSVLDEPRAAELRERAFDASLAALLEQGEAALEFVAAHGERALRVAVMDLFSQLRSLGEEQPSLPSCVARGDVALAAAQLVAACERLELAIAGAGSGKLVARARERARLCAERAAARRPPPEAIKGGNAAALRLEELPAFEAARALYAATWADARALEDAPLIDRLLCGYGDAYDALKLARGALDFDDLELRAGALLEVEGPAVAERFELVMVDEFQDTNARQMALLSRLDRGNLFVVGDERQSIYGFRHADVEIFTARRAAAPSLELTANFRTRGPIVDEINRAFSTDPRGDFAPLVAARPRGAETAAQGPLVELVLVDSCDQPEWRAIEAGALAARVAELVADGEAEPGDVAVLLRSASDIDIYEQALSAAGLPTLAATGAGFWRRPEIVDLVSYARVIANPQDELAMLNVLASPLVGLSSDQLIAGLGDEQLERWLGEERRRAPFLPVDELIGRAIDWARYDEHLLRLPSGRRRLANVRKLLAIARGFVDGEGGSLRRFLDSAAAALAGGAREPDAPIGDERAVRLMTVHAAKGLEFGVVCVADLGRRRQLDSPLMLSDGQRFGVRVRTLEDPDLAPALAWEELHARRRAAAEREERRIFYVALTRAKERLLLSGGADWGAWPRADAKNAPALAWLAPALIPDLAQRLARGEACEDVGGVRLHLAARRELAAARDLATGRDLAEGGHAAAGGLSIANGPDPAQAAPLAADEVQRSAEGGGAVRHTPCVRSPPGRFELESVACDFATISYSSLADFGRCGYRYYLRRVVGLPEIASPVALSGGHAAARGRVVHSMLERAERQWDDEQLAAELRGEGLVDSDEERGRVRALVAAFERSDLARRVADAEEVRREVGFAIPLGDDAPLLSGFIDLIASERGGGALVVDYKTDAVAELESLGLRVERDYRAQQRAYALAALLGGASEVEVAYCFLRRPEELVSERFVPAQIAELERDLLALAEPLMRGSFEVTSRPHRELCARCPGRPRLCSWAEEVTLAEVD
ncbi:MAG: UvrD-helicase domain-containing protein [Solirubrobacteraceae bacterium]